jgi:hypothetical protein
MVPHSGTMTNPHPSVVVEGVAVVYDQEREEGAHTEGLIDPLEDRRTVDVTTKLRRHTQCEMQGGRQVVGRHAVNL